MWRAIRAIFKWASVVVGLIVLTVAAFAIGWKSWVPPKMQLQASTRPTLEASTRANDLVRNTNIKEKPAQPVDQLIEDAMGAARFGGGMGLGSAKAMQLIESLKVSELPSAFAAVVEGELTASREKIAQLILDHWSTIDPNAAMEACATAFTSREKFLDMSYTPLRHFSAADPAGAFEAWNTYFAPLDRDYDNSTEFRLGVIFGEWGKQNLDEAFTSYQTLDGENADGALGGLLDTDSQRVLAMLEESGDYEALSTGRTKIVGDLARAGKHEDAIAMLDRFPLDPETRKKSEQDIAWGWFESDQRAAIDWLLERSDETNRRKRLADFARRWADWEANAAGAWLGDMVGQYGAEADKAVRYFATTIAQQDPATALDWIATIEDPAERLKAADRVGREFGERMTEGVESWIDSSKLGDAERAVVLEASNRTRF